MMRKLSINWDEETLQKGKELVNDRRYCNKMHIMGDPGYNLAGSLGRKGSPIDFQEVATIHPSDEYFYSDVLNWKATTSTEGFNLL